MIAVGPVVSFNIGADVNDSYAACWAYECNDTLDVSVTVVGYLLGQACIYHFINKPWYEIRFVIQELAENRDPNTVIHIVMLFGVTMN